MKYEIYKEIRSSDDFSIFDFVSVGKRGSILKRIEFTPTEIPGFFNLAFGDADENGEIDDYIISDNGDRNKILATVNLEALTLKFEIFAEQKDKIVPFEKNIEATGLLVKKNNLNLNDET